MSVYVIVQYEKFLNNSQEHFELSLEKLTDNEEFDLVSVQYRSTFRSNYLSTVPTKQ